MIRIKPIAAILALVLLWGCDSLLDTKPKQSIGEGQALSNSANVQAVLLGGYDNLGSYYLYGGQMYMLPDLMAVGQEAQWSGTYEEPGQIYRKDIRVDNGFVRDLWLDAYSTVNITNNVLSALDVVDADIRDRVEGEAKFLRAAIYFQLVRLYGKDYNDGDPTSNLGVPLVLQPTRGIGEDANVSRSTVQQVYDQVISDLSDAKSKLPASNDVYADTYSASAFLARVYLQQADYGNAAAEASRVIESGNYSLVADYADEFNNSNSNTSEDIFDTQVTSQDGTNSLQTFYASQQYGGRGDIEIQQAHLARYDTTDARYEFFYDDPITGEIRTGKWRNQYGNVVVVRLAEMYMIRAEANFREGTDVGDTPLNDVNRIRERAGLADLSSVTLQDILDERYRELAFEGHFLWDLKRTKGAVGSVQWNDPTLVFPIPQREIDANPGLEGQQNPGYGG